MFVVSIKASILYFIAKGKILEFYILNYVRK